MNRIILLLFFISTAACTPKSSISAKEWKLTKINDLVLQPRTVPTIQFMDNEKKISGFAGCNRYFGSYTLNGKSLSFSGIGSTKMFCNETMDLEQQFLEALQQVDSFEVTQTSLRLYTQKRLVLEFN